MADTNFPSTTSTSTDIDNVYEQLVNGVGHELVTEGNVQELISRAEKGGHPILATELKEWQAPC